ncbi:MAG: ATP-binding protein [Pseudomonadota bacterium]
MVGFWAALVLGCFFISTYVYLIEREARRMSDALTATQMALIREQKVSALGALAAAAAHELGSPLSTIRLVAKELVRDLPKDSDLRDDVELLVSESDRCRTILTELSRKPEPSSENPFDRLALPTMIDEIARPRLPPTVQFAVEIDAKPSIPAPEAYFGPEIQHGLGNLLQNASQFAGRKVTVRLHWTDQVVIVTVEDDGPGYPSQIIDRLGEPYVSGRVKKGENLGLGIFIAQTLLESLGADLTFSNPPRGGARVTIHWSRKLFEEGPAT